MDFGSAIHAGLAEFYSTGSQERALLAFEQCPVLPPEQLGYGKVMLEEYWKHYGDDGQWKLMGAERTLSADIEGHQLVGRLDLVVEDTAMGGLWHVQHKTVGNTVGTVNYCQRFMLSWHERAYALLGQLNGLPIRGSIINILRKVPFDNRKSKWRDGENPVFYRHRVVIGKELVERFKQDFLVLAARMEQPVRTQNPNSCMDYNRVCAFLQLCRGLPVETFEWETRKDDYVDLLRSGNGDDGSRSGSVDDVVVG
jgi:hypothetical protein